MHEHFPEALALSFVNNEYLVELQELPMKEHIERLRNLSGLFQHYDMLLMYYNGLRITGQEHTRLKQPMPGSIDGQYDDTD